MTYMAKGYNIPNQLYFSLFFTRKIKENVAVVPIHKFLILTKFFNPRLLKIVFLLQIYRTFFSFNLTSSYFLLRLIFNITL